MSEPVRGLGLSRYFFSEVVKPLVDRRFPALRYAAAMLGPGSEVLGYDDEMSTDHNWGPRVYLFLREDERSDCRHELDAFFRDNLPPKFRGFSTHFSEPDPSDNGTQLPVTAAGGPIRHKIAISTTSEFFETYLGADLRQDIEPEDWLTFPQQKLRTITSGEVFHDDIELGAMRERVRYYPRDVWLYLLASGWTRIGQEEHLMGRAGSVGDEIGAALIAARLVRDLMRLCFLMEREYAPYPKWFGTAFAQLRCASSLTGPLLGVVTADSWQTRERYLVDAYEFVASMHNSLGITAPISAKARLFFNRPFRVIALNGFADAIVAEIRDPSTRRILRRPLIGGVDQFSDSTDLVENSEFRAGLKRLTNSRQQRDEWARSSS